VAMLHKSYMLQYMSDTGDYGIYSSKQCCYVG